MDIGNGESETEARPLELGLQSLIGLDEKNYVQVPALVYLFFSLNPLLLDSLMSLLWFMANNLYWP